MLEGARFLVCVPFALVILSCAPGALRETREAAGTGQGQASPQRTLVVAVRGEPPSVASLPLVAFSNSFSRPKELFNATLDVRDEVDRPHPVLAESLPQLNTDSWRVLPDGRMETTYRLKANLSWQDGTALSAEDFVFAWRVYANPEFGRSTTPPVGPMEEVLAPDARTVVIRWRQLYPDAIALDRDFQALPRHILAQPFGSLDPSAFSSLPFWASEYVGLGPYRLTGWEPGAFLLGTAFDNYVLGRPKIDRVKVEFITDPQTALAGMLAGEVHFVADPLFSAAEGDTLEQRWAQDGGGTILYPAVGFRAVNVQVRPEYVESPALLDVRVRKAVRLSLDVPAADEVVASGKGLVSNTIVSPRVDFFPQIERIIEKYAYDARRASQLMEQAGFLKGPDGFFAGPDSKRVQFNVYCSAGERFEAEATVYVDSLRRAGLDVGLRVISVQQLNDPMARALLAGIQIRGGADKHLSYTGDQIPRPENRWQGDNRGGWRNAAYDRAHEEYLRSLDPSERVGHVAEMERLINEDAAVIPLMYSPYVVPLVAALKGPVSMQVPRSPNNSFLSVHLWEWRS